MSRKTFAVGETIRQSHINAVREIEAENARLKIDLEVAECLQVSAVHAAIKLGWNFGFCADEAGFAAATKGTEHIARLKELRFAYAALTTKGEK